MYLPDLKPFDPASATEIARPIRVQQGVPSGLIAGTMVRTGSGDWQPVEALPEGAAVQRLDGGLVRPLRLERRRVRPREQGVVILLPEGCLGAGADLVLLPGQPLLVDTHGDPALESARYALVPALAALALKGPRALRPEAAFEVVIPHFAGDEMVRVQSEVVLFCPAQGDAPGPARSEANAFPRLSLAAARNFLRRRAIRLEN